MGLYIPTSFFFYFFFLKSGGFRADLLGMTDTTSTSPVTSTSTDLSPEERAELATLLMQGTLGASQATNVEWDWDTEQFLLSVDKSDFVRFAQIQLALRREGLYTDEFVNGHGFVRPREAGRALDLQLDYWTYTLNE